MWCLLSLHRQSRASPSNSSKHLKTASTAERHLVERGGSTSIHYAMDSKISCEYATRECDCTRGLSPDERQKGPQGRIEDAVEFNCMPQTETIGGGRPPPSINENLPSPDCFKEPRSHDSCQRQSHVRLTSHAWSPKFSFGMCKFSEMQNMLEFQESPYFARILKIV